jgi:hypothetical protein
LIVGTRQWTPLVAVAMLPLTLAMRMEIVAGLTVGG